MRAKGKGVHSKVESEGYSGKGKLCRSVHISPRMAKTDATDTTYKVWKRRIPDSTYGAKGGRLAE